MRFWHTSGHDRGPSRASPGVPAGPRGNPDPSPARGPGGHLPPGGDRGPRSGGAASRASPGNLVRQLGGPAKAPPGPRGPGGAQGPGGRGPGVLFVVGPTSLTNYFVSESIHFID